jgi:hypothetical protein
MIKKKGIKLLSKVAALAVFLSQLSFAATTPLECRSVDYTELQQFNKKDLESKFCLDHSALDLALKFSLIAINASQELLDNGSPERALAWSEENKYNVKVFSDCANEIKRTERVLQQRKLKNPKCK